MIEEAAIAKLQDILVAGRVLEEGKRAKFADLFTSDHASKAK